MLKIITLPHKSVSKFSSWKTLFENDNIVIGHCKLYKGCKCMPHYHDIFEIYIITNGKGIMLKNSDWFYVKKGDVITINPGEKHCCETNSMIEITYIFNQGPFKNIKYYKDSNILKSKL